MEPPRGGIRLPSEPNTTSTSHLLHLLLQSRRPSDARRLLLKNYRLHGLPLRIRPAFVVLTSLTLLTLSLLGFHPTLAHRISPPVPFSDKILHFLCFFLATIQFYAIWSVDESARRVWYWNWWAEGITIIVCAGVGSIGSEFVQALLPYKTFQWGDVVANLLGTGLGIFLARSLSQSHRRAQEIRRLYRPLDMSLDVPSDSESDDEDSFPLGTAREMEEGRMGNRAEAGLGGGRGSRAVEDPWDDRDDPIFVMGDEDEEEAQDTVSRRKEPEDGDERT